MNIEELFDIVRVKRTELVGNAKNVISTYFEVPKRHPGDQWQAESATDETEPANSWQQYGFISRLPAKAEALILRWGENTFTLASRLLVAAKVYGQLAGGDVAMFAAPGNMIKCGADGSISFRVPCDNGRDMMLVMSPKNGGSFKFLIPDGPAIEWSAKQGIYQDAGMKPCTLSTTDKMQFVSAQQLDMCSVHQLHRAGAKPLNAATVAAGGAPQLLI